MDEETKQRIDKMNYTEMLTIWRFGEDSNPLLIRPTGTYFKEQMGEKKKKLTHEQRVSASKFVGWDPK